MGSIFVFYLCIVYIEYVNSWFLISVLYPLSTPYIKYRTLNKFFIIIIHYLLLLLLLLILVLIILFGLLLDNISINTLLMYYVLLS